jgi:hypothetical protein
MSTGFEDRDNGAILFPNFAKKQPKHPDWTGSGMVGGKKYRLSAWKKQGRKTEFFSIAFTDEAAQAAQQHRPTTEPAEIGAEPKREGDDILF